MRILQLLFFGTGLFLGYLFIRGLVYHHPVECLWLLPALGCSVTSGYLSGSIKAKKQINGKSQ